jgi:hypothetical protein
MEVPKWDPYQWDPFEMAAKRGSVNGLRALVEIYECDTSQTALIEARLRVGDFYVRLCN